jgi:hypothetical protein
MAEALPADEQTNYETFRDCLSEPVLKALAGPVEKPKNKDKRHAKKNSKGKTGIVRNEKNSTISNRDARSSDAEDLGEFIEVHPPYQPCEPPADCPSTSAASSSRAYPSSSERSHTPSSETPCPSKTATPHHSQRPRTPVCSNSYRQTPSTASRATASSHPPATRPTSATFSCPSLIHTQPP